MTSDAFQRLFEPLEIGDFTVRNRIVNPTHGTALDEERDIRYLQERARGGAGLLGVHASAGVSDVAFGPGTRFDSPGWDRLGTSSVSPAGIALYDDRTLPGLRRRAEVVHAEGARCFAQVYHAGSARHGARVSAAVGPSSVADPYEGNVPHVLDEGEIEELVVAFAHGIRRCAEGGMDAAEIHGAHGYLVGQFFSPYFNRRDDRWGGSLANRVRFVTEIISTARTMVGANYPIGIRVGVEGDGRTRGLTHADLADVCGLLSPHVAYVSVSGGGYSGFGHGLEPAYVGPPYADVAQNATAAAAVRAAVDVPTICTGRVVDAATAEQILSDGAADLIGMVRALIADPELPRKVRSGRGMEVRRCIGLQECHHIGKHRTPLTCGVNAAAGREDEMRIIASATPRRVLVVGAGPAGLEAARVAALRGHQVLLADAAHRIGGVPAVLATDPNRRILGDHSSFFGPQLADLGIELLLGTLIDSAAVAELHPDVVVVATGALPFVPDVPGIGADHVVTAIDVLRGAPTTDRVIVVGGLDSHMAAPTIAEYLADQGKQVEMISERFDFADGIEDGTRLMLIQRLQTKSITVSLLHRLESITSNGAIVAPTFHGEPRLCEDVSVVLACGSVADDRLARQLSSTVADVHVIGDALAPRRIMHATLDGARVAMGL